MNGLKRKKEKGNTNKSNKYLKSICIIFKNTRTYHMVTRILYKVGLLILGTNNNCKL